MLGRARRPQAGWGVARSITLLLIFVELAACGYFLPEPHPPPCPLSCPSFAANPRLVKFAPIPDEANVGAVPQGGGPTVTASCDSNATCQNLALGLVDGTYAIAVDANGYKSASVSMTFTRVDGTCCAGLTPLDIPISLDPN